MKPNLLIIYGSFEWEESKAQANFAKHEITFEEASTVFDDPLFIVFKDPDHSIREERYIILGQSQRRRYLIVSFTERERTRLISARELDSRERKAYEQKKEPF
jgi:uncharacterized DUF497 family protein